MQIHILSTFSRLNISAQNSSQWSKLKIIKHCMLLAQIYAFSIPQFDFVPISHHLFWSKTFHGCSTDKIGLKNMIYLHFWKRRRGRGGPGDLIKIKKPCV